MKPAILSSVTILGFGAAGLGHAALVLDQIGSGIPTTTAPGLNHVLTDLSDYSTIALDNFTVGPAEVGLTQISALFRADGGFASFSQVDGYRLNIYSSPVIASSTLTGDIVSLLFPQGPEVFVAQVADPNHLAEFGLVTLFKEVTLPGPGSYWLSLSPVSSSATGYFQLAAATASGGDGTAKQANPGGGFSLPGNLTTTGTDFAYLITAIPEPSAAWLAALGGVSFIRRRGRGGIECRKLRESKPKIPT